MKEVWAEIYDAVKECGYAVIIAGLLANLFVIGLLAALFFLAPPH